MPDILHRVGIASTATKVYKALSTWTDCPTGGSVAPQATLARVA
jgi:hypothetical protein